MVWPGGSGHAMVYAMACGHHMVYGLACRTAHGIRYGLARYVMVCGKA